VINLSSSRINAFSNDDIRSISIFSAFASSILNNAILYNDMSEVNNRLVKAVNTLKVTQKKLKQEIEEGKRAEYELVKSREFLEKIFKTSVDGIIIADAKGNIILVNDAVEKMLGCSRDRLVGMHTSEFGFEERDYQESGKELIRQLLSNGTVSGVERTWLKMDGKTLDIEMNIALLKDSRGDITGSVASIRDITERKQAEEKLIHNQEQLRSLASQLTRVEEQERRNIASYLHDHLGQELFAMKLQLEQFKKSLPANHTIKTLESAIERTNQMMSDMRSMSYELSPPILYELGLEAALEWIIEEMRTIHPVTITFHDDGQAKPLDESTKVLLFQAVRELLHNVTRHAKAHNVEISVARDNAMVIIQVNDDGIGFEGSEADKSKEKTQGFGLYSIKERLRYSGGNLAVESALNRGARITLKAPLQR
jgi:PAS domain S-box-containing protein